MKSGAPLHLRLASGIAGVPAEPWDALFPADYPFARHAYLAGLERCGCVGGETGWEPAHLLAEDEGGRLVGAAPLYVKHHSYGEFVFDWAWADASHRLGRHYYPKLLSAVPFVPSTGPRLGAIDSGVRGALARGLAEFTKTLDCSSSHVLFADDEDADALKPAGFLERRDVQFHWRDRGYGDFAGFLAQLTSEKRKKILRERRRVAEAGIRFEICDGSGFDERRWREIHSLYAGTYRERGMPPYLNAEFLVALSRLPGQPLRLILAFHDRRLVAMALTLIGGETLYGRHWGAAETYHSLHFECCYYQGIELCLRMGLKRFDAGTQGEHKLNRGFEPVMTQSRHFLADSRLREAVDRYLQRERAAVAARHEELMHHTPYRADLNATMGP